MKEWYLIGNNTKPNSLGGFENQAFVDYKDDAFAETLETDIADTVVLYNYDLSESKVIRAVIQGNTGDTYLASMERSILTPMGTLHSGDYIFFEDEYWIVDGRPGNNKIYEKATLKECQYKLRWQKNDGTIIERWANLTTASKYDTGVYMGKTICLTSDDFTIIIPNDADGMTIEYKRVFIDLAEVPTKVFEICRNDDVLFNHASHGGTLSLIASKTELNKDTDNQELRLCNYIDVSKSDNIQSSVDSSGSDYDKTTILFTAIITGIPTLKLGYSRIFTVLFTDEAGDEMNWEDVDFEWNVMSDFNIVEDPYDNKIKLSVESDEDLIDKTFTLQCLSNGSVVAETKVAISEGF